jgi:hypothetical protein
MDPAILVLVLLLWGFWAFYATYCAWKLRRGPWVSLLVGWATLSAACLVLAGLDNTNMRVFDCRPEVNVHTGEDMYSCAVDHWLPDPVWRVVNP